MLTGGRIPTTVAAALSWPIHELAARRHRDHPYQRLFFAYRRQDGPRSGARSQPLPHPGDRRCHFRGPGCRRGARRTAPRDPDRRVGRGPAREDRGMPGTLHRRGRDQGWIRAAGAAARPAGRGALRYVAGQRPAPRVLERSGAGARGAGKRWRDPRHSQTPPDLRATLLERGSPRASRAARRGARHGLCPGQAHDLQPAREGTRYPGAQSFRHLHRTDRVVAGSSSRVHPRRHAQRLRARRAGRCDPRVLA